jgi:predicted amidohydrolase
MSTKELLAIQRVAAVQMVSTTSVDTNLKLAAGLIQQAAAQGAKYVVLPEYFCLMGQKDTDKLAIAEPFMGLNQSHSNAAAPLQTFLSTQAKVHGVWLLGGTIPLKATPHQDRVYNSLLVYSPDGACVVRYDKLYLFRFKNSGESYDEANTLVAGDRAVTLNCDGLGRVGLSICYDLRFPELYRALNDHSSADSGARSNPCNVMVVVAAFTETTGRAHWEALLRARAIENQCYVIASGQGGTHENGRTTFGHSMIVSPWGEIKALQATGEGVVIADINLTQLARIRQQLPALEHRRSDWRVL